MLLPSAESIGAQNHEREPNGIALDSVSPENALGLVTRCAMTTERRQPSSVESNRRRPPRPRRIKVKDDEGVPEYVRDDESSRLEINAEDCVWIGDDGTLDPIEVLRQKGFEQKNAFRLLIEAIVDANPREEDGPTRAQRIDRAEALLLGRPLRPGVDEFDDDEVLRLVAKRYFEQWHEYSDREIEVAPIAKTILNEFDLGSREHNINSAVRRIVRKFRRDRDRLLASVTHDPRWDPPQVYLDLFSIIGTLKRLGVKATPDALLSRMNRKEWSQSPANKSGAKGGE